MSVEKAPISSKESLGTSLATSEKANRLPAADLRDAAYTNTSYRDEDISREIARIDAERESLRLGLEAYGRSSTTPPVAIEAPSAEPFIAKQRLKSIRDLPSGTTEERAERRKTLTEFKKTLQEQREAMAAYRNDVEKILLSNPDAPTPELLRKLDEYEKKHRFSPEERQVVTRLFTNYKDAREKAKELRNSISDDRELVRSVTGVEVPQGKNVEVVLGPMNIVINTDQETAQLLYGGYRRDVFEVNGFKSLSPDGVYFTVINKDSPEAKTILEHEQQHVINDLFQKEFEKDTEIVRLELNGKYRRETDPVKKKETAIELMNSSNKWAYERAKDEIFATLTDPAWLNSRLRPLLKPNNGSPYDYLKAMRELQGNDPLWNSLSEEIMVKEYSETVDKAVTIASDLTRILAPKEIIALLADEPLERWSIAASRIYQEKLHDATIKAKEVKDIKERLDKIAEGREGAEQKGESYEKHDAHDAKNTHTGSHGHGKHGHESHGHGGHGHALSAKDYGILGGAIAAAGLGEWAVTSIIMASPVGPLIPASLAAVGLPVTGFWGGALVWSGAIGVAMLGGSLLYAFWKYKDVLWGELSKAAGGSGGGGSKPAPKKAAGGGGGGDHGHGH